MPDEKITIQLTYKQAMIISGFLEASIPSIWASEALDSAKKEVDEACSTYLDQVREETKKRNTEYEAQRALHDLLGSAGFELV